MRAGRRHHRVRRRQPGRRPRQGEDQGRLRVRRAVRRGVPPKVARRARRSRRPPGAPTSRSTSTARRPTAGCLPDLLLVPDRLPDLRRAKTARPGQGFSSPTSSATEGQQAARGTTPAPPRSPRARARRPGRDRHHRDQDVRRPRLPSGSSATSAVVRGHAVHRRASPGSPGDAWATASSPGLPPAPACVDPARARRRRDLPDRRGRARLHRAKPADPSGDGEPRSATSGRWSSAPCWRPLIALLIATPLSIGVALFISHYAPRRLAVPLGYLIDLLAAVPSVVYGLWGIFFLAPAHGADLRSGWRPPRLHPALRGTGLDHRPHDPHRRRSCSRS